MPMDEVRVRTVNGENVFRTGMGLTAEQIMTKVKQLQEIPEKEKWVLYRTSGGEDIDPKTNIRYGSYYMVQKKQKMRQLRQLEPTLVE